MKKHILSLFLLGTFLFPQSGILIMSPEPDSEISGKDVLIALSTLTVGGVNPNSIQLILDGEDITEDAYIDEDMVSCLITQLDPGEHIVTLYLEGEEAEQWTFFTTEREPILDYSGRIRTSSSIDQIDDYSLNINQLMVDFKGSAYEWLKLKTNIRLTTQENILFQPRNVFGVEFAIHDYATIRIGDSNPRLSHFTLNGKRIRGLNASLKFGWVNLDIIKGQINRAIDGDLSKAYSYEIDTNDDGDKFLSLNRTGYTFAQNTLSGRLSFGRGEKFQWGLNVLKAKDDISSVSPILNDASIVYSPDAAGTIAGLDSGVVYTLAELGSNAVVLDGKDWTGEGPKDNLVVGTDLGLSLFNKRLRLDGEIAFSLTNSNIWGGPMTLAELDTLADDSVDNKLIDYDLSSFPDPADYSDLIIINPNLVPLIPIEMSALEEGTSTADRIDAFFSMPSLAYRGRAVTNFFGNYLALEYSQVGPEFNSLANPYLVKNKREYSISDKIKLFQNRLMFTVGYKYQDDDILTTVETVKSQNTLSFGVNAIPGPHLPTVNVSIRSIGRSNGINELVNLTDSTFTDNREKTESINLVFNLNHRFNLVFPHVLNGTFVTVDKQDKFSDRDSNFVDPAMSTQVMNVSLSTRYGQSLKTNLNVTSNSSELSTGPGVRGSQDFFTTNFDVEYPFLDGQLLTKSGINFANGSGLVDMSWIGFKSGIRWKMMKGFNLNLNGEFRSKETGGVKKNTIIARAFLEYSF